MENISVEILIDIEMQKNLVYAIDQKIKILCGMDFVATHILKALSQFQNL
jgi:hypothetical protein